MIKLHYLNSTNDRENFLKNFNPEKKSWIVSDLKAKFEIQNFLLEKNNYFEERSVLRASELWRTILNRHDFTFKIVSKDFIRAWLRDEVESLNHPILKNQGIDSLIDFMELFVQISTNPNGNDILRQWLDDNLIAKMKWGFWFDISSELTAKLFKQKLIASNWISSFLTNIENFETFWSQGLVFDLGAELTRAEATLISQMSKAIDIEILVPPLFDFKKYKYLFTSYFDLISSFDEKSSISFKNKNSTLEFQKKIKDKSASFKKVTSPLSEVKFVTGQLRTWIESGVRPDKIAIISTQIEKYWNLLVPYFENEGVEANKDLTIRIQNLPHVHLWISKLNLASKSFDYSDLESAFYNKEALEKRFESFHSLFINLLDETDLERDQIIKNSFLTKYRSKDRINLNEFIGQMMRFWTDLEKTEDLFSIIKEIFLHANEEQEFKFETWIYWLKQILSKKEIKIKKANQYGVQILNILSADSSFYTHRIFLGLTEDQFLENTLQLVSSFDVEKVFSDTGYLLNHPERNLLSYQIDWSDLSSNVTSIYLYPMTSFAGSIEAPHRFWLENALDHEVHTPTQSRWNSIQGQKKYESALAENLKSTDQKNDLIKQISFDENIFNIEVSPSIEHSIIASYNGNLSPSSLELYYNCPFKFAAGKIFRLLDESELDMDPDSRKQGNLVHQLFYTLTAEPRKFDWSIVEIQNLLEEIYNKDPFLSDLELWSPLREKIIKTAISFLDFEKNEFSAFSKMILHREKDFIFEYDQYRYKGKIDRIDLLKTGGLAIIDYKPKNRNYRFKNWIKENHLQVLFYTWAMSQNHIKNIEPKLIKAAWYYIYKDFSLEGLEVDSDSISVLEESFKLLENLIKQFHSDLRDGKFEAKPLDVENCKFCKWSRLCRAPHLNS